MQKIIPDTNVIVSALISNSIPTRILYDIVCTKSVDPYLSNDILDKYIEVLGRDKFNRFVNFRSKADVVITKLNELASFYLTDRKIDVLTDASDNKFLELAAVSSADHLITENTLDFTIDEFEYTRILTPQEYQDTYKP